MTNIIKAHDRGSRYPATLAIDFDTEQVTCQQWHTWGDRFSVSIGDESKLEGHHHKSTWPIDLQGGRQEMYRLIYTLRTRGKYDMDDCSRGVIEVEADYIYQCAPAMGAMRAKRGIDPDTIADMIQQMLYADDDHHGRERQEADYTPDTMSPGSYLLVSVVLIILLFVCAAELVLLLA